MFSLCGGFRNVIFKNNDLVVTIDDKASYDILCQKNNFEKIEEFLKSINNSFGLNIVFNKKNENVEKNIEKLKSLFDNNLFVK